MIGSAGERGEGDDADQRAFERADVAVMRLGDRSSTRGVGDSSPSCWTRLRRIASARGEVGRGDVGDQAGLEALAQAILERDQVARHAVGRQDELGAVSYSALNVWKNSSSVFALLSRNWTSSISSTSLRRKRPLKRSMSPRLDRGDELVCECSAVV